MAKGLIRGEEVKVEDNKGSGEKEILAFDIRDIIWHCQDSESTINIAEKIIELLESRGFFSQLNFKLSEEEIEKIEPLAIELMISEGHKGDWHVWTSKKQTTWGEYYIKKATAKYLKERESKKIHNPYTGSDYLIKDGKIVGVEKESKSCEQEEELKREEDIKRCLDFAM
jgi:hypothetical protein